MKQREEKKKLKQFAFKKLNQKPETIDEEDLFMKSNNESQLSLSSDVLNEVENDEPKFEIRKNSGVKLLKIDLLNTMRIIQPNYKFLEINKPKRNLTENDVPKGNNGHDNEEYNLIVFFGDIIDNYKVIELLGQGMSGQVFLVEDISDTNNNNKKEEKNKKNKQENMEEIKEEENNNLNNNDNNNENNNEKNVDDNKEQGNNKKKNNNNNNNGSEKYYALKIIKNKKIYENQSLCELQILTALNEIDKNDVYHIIRVYNYFHYRNHLCIVFELLNENLYQILSRNYLEGLTLKSIKFLTKKILEALELIHSQKIIHCDLKPENILIKHQDNENSNRPGIKVSLKVTDFGSACYENHTIFTYIQSRYYRAPEIILGLPYNNKIDIWSLGLIVAELYLGSPLLPGTNSYDQLKKIEQVFGKIPQYLIKNCKDRDKYFDINLSNKNYILKDEDEYYKNHPKDKRDDNYKVPYDIKSLDDLLTLKRESKLRKFTNNISSNSSFNSSSTCNISDIHAFVHFLKCTLSLDPQNRYSAYQCLKHPFITNENFESFIAGGGNNNHFNFNNNSSQNDLYNKGRNNMNNRFFMNNNNNINCMKYPYNNLNANNFNNNINNMMNNNNCFMTNMNNPCNNRSFTNYYNNSNYNNTNSYDYNLLQNSNNQNNNNNSSFCYPLNLNNIPMMINHKFPLAYFGNCNLRNQNINNNNNNDQKRNKTFMINSFEKLNNSCSGYGNNYYGNNNSNYNINNYNNMNNNNYNNNYVWINNNEIINTKNVNNSICYKNLNFQNQLNNFRNNIDINNDKIQQNNRRNSLFNNRNINNNMNFNNVNNSFITNNNAYAIFAQNMNFNNNINMNNNNNKSFNENVTNFERHNRRGRGKTMQNSNQDSPKFPFPNNFIYDNSNNNQSGNANTNYSNNNINNNNSNSNNK